MSKSYKISLLRFQTQCPNTEGISKYKEYTQIPMSPTLMDSLSLSNEIKNEYLIERQKIIKRKTERISYDDRLRPYQNQDVHFLLSLKNKANFNEQRVGKTPETLVCIQHLKETENTIIIVPGSLLYHWLDEYKYWTRQDNIIVISNKTTKQKRTEIYKNFKGTIITTYGLILNDLPLLLNRKIDTIIIDEADRLRNYRSLQSPYSPKTAKAIIKLSQQAVTRYALTATPAPNSQHNIYGILAFLFPTLFKSYWDFIEYYFNTYEEQINADGDTILQIGNFKNNQKQQELLEFIELISIQRKRTEIMPWLREPKPIKITLPICKKLNKYHKELHQLYEIEEEKLTTINTLERMTRERQLAVDPQLLKINITSVKTEWIQEYRKDYPNKNIIIVSMFTSYLKRLKAIFSEAELLIGETTPKNRHEIEKRFNQKEIKILLCNLDVAKFGMKLYGADSMIFTDRSLTCTDNEQMMNRLLAITEAIAKNMEPQDIIILLTESFIDKYLDEAQTAKKKVTDIVNDYRRALLVAARRNT